MAHSRIVLLKVKYENNVLQKYKFYGASGVVITFYLRMHSVSSKNTST